ncbi:hypothetical protein [Desulfopila aestuarii]|uniref:ABM domain-containing protein n=1 Tax=Desulfopila aestuarii DSM 18488 TaxID=1121416 RepID=A0A1M7YIW3_9BACT|nr:hypothetical protein [Desulfopila aestuarii]SHO52584.1 hypothetical protein SAMN02745220_04640 [Desulfopila aestuarii DSM 18488]
MYARITTYHCKAEKLSEAIALLEKLKPEAMKIPGLKKFFSSGNEDGNCALIGIYESREASEDALDTVRALFANFSGYIDSELEQRGYEIFVHGENQ